MFSISLKVTVADTDIQKHVNNVAYVRWIQDVAVAHWRSAATSDMQKAFAWMVVRHEIDYKKQAFEGDKLIVSTWVGEPSRVSWERFTEIKRGEELLVKARSVWCLIDSEREKPTRITKDLKELF